MMEFMLRRCYLLGKWDCGVDFDGSARSRLGYAGPMDLLFLRLRGMSDIKIGTKNASIWTDGMSGRETLFTGSLCADRNKMRRPSVCRRIHSSTHLDGFKIALYLTGTESCSMTVDEEPQLLLLASIYEHSMSGSSSEIKARRRFYCSLSLPSAAVASGMG